MAELTLIATGVGARDTWTLSAGSTKPLAVNSPDDGDTSYITSPGINYQDFTGDTSVLTGATITAVVVTASIKRGGTPAGTFTIGYSFTPDGGGDQSGSTGPTSSSSAYVTYTHTDTGLSVDWGSDFIFWVQGNHATRLIRCSTLYATITYTPPADSQYSIDFNGTSTNVDCGSDSSLDNLHDGAFTVEAWVKADGYGDSNYGRIVVKDGATANGWLFTTNFAWGIEATVYCSTTRGSATTASTADFPTDGTWCHVAFTWDDSSYTSPRIWVNGVEKTTELTARDGTILADASYDLIIGNRVGAARALDGEIAWVRISDTVRWTTTFTPDAKDTPPASDANTVEQWNMNTGSGTTAVAEESSPTNDGTIANGSWVEITGGAAADVLNRGISGIESGVIASQGGGYSGLHPIEQGYIS